MTTHDGPTYAFQDDTPVHHHHNRKGYHRHKKSQEATSHKLTQDIVQSQYGSGQPEQDSDPTDGGGSLTYSASSSIHSGSSATGESTDSSFADIMRVLDIDPNYQSHAAEMAVLISKDPNNNFLLQQQAAMVAESRKSVQVSAGRSVASGGDSLIYSEDGESSYGESHLPQTITGQPSDSHGPDGGGLGGLDDTIFAPAMPGDRRIRRSKAKKENRFPASTTSKKTPANDRKAVAMNTSKLSRHGSNRSSPAAVPSDVSAGSISGATPTSPPPRARGPPRKSRSIAGSELDENGGELWYSKWWMCGFTDALNLGPHS